MNFIPSIAEWSPDGRASAVTVGMFDGVHLGHQALVREMQQAHEGETLRSVVLTFDQPPRLFAGGQPSARCITVLDEKIEILAGLGVEMCGVIPVASGLLLLEAAEFVAHFLVGRLSAKRIIVGCDFRFGHNRGGDVSLLRSLGKTFGFAVVEAPTVVIDGAPVKSTRIRHCLQEGNMPGAAELMGRPYSLRGPVTMGQQLARKLGFPTANIQPPPDKLLPAPGVYAGFGRAGGALWPAAINLGTRPTVNGTEQVLEAHLLGFQDDLYGQEVTLEFRERLRMEQRFEDLEALKTQVHLDLSTVEQWAAKQ